MNYSIPNLPERTSKPRTSGFTMAMDKGMSAREAEDFMSNCADHVDIIKFGWATSYVTPSLEKKIQIYKEAGVPCYFGGTLFEAFIVRNQFDEYRKLLDKFQLEYAEVSDGSIDMEQEDKLNYISTLAKQVTVLSEVGSKDSEKIIPPYKWIELMQTELDAGAWKVIGESRESGNVGLFRSTGEVRSGLVQEIITKIPPEKIIWEAPQKAQQVWFVKLIGANVNLGNIAPSEVIPLETLRLGLRSDTLGHFIGLKRRKENDAPPFHAD